MCFVGLCWTDASRFSSSINWCFRRHPMRSILMATHHKHSIRRHFCGYFWKLLWLAAWIACVSCTHVVRHVRIHFQLPTFLIESGYFRAPRFTCRPNQSIPFEMIKSFDSGYATDALDDISQALCLIFIDRALKGNFGHNLQRIYITVLA